MRIFFSSRFKRDAKRFRHDARATEALGVFIAAMTSEIPLDPRLRDHALVGNLKGYRECHLLPDVLLVYEVDLAIGAVTLARIGTHAELFGK